MQVALPELLSVLAHELRSPLAVLQGYIRLLQRQRPASDPEVAMLTAMLDATGRLAEMGKQASDLSVFLKRPAPQTPASVSVPALLSDIASEAAGIAVTDCPRALSTATIQTDDRAMLVLAISTLAQLAMREAGQRSATIVPNRESTNLQLTLQPTLPANVARDPHTVTSRADDRSTPFNGGGMGLSLIVASYVLEAHRARVTVAQGSGQLQVLLPMQGEPA